MITSLTTLGSDFFTIELKKPFPCFFGWLVPVLEVVSTGSLSLVSCEERAESYL